MKRGTVVPHIIGLRRLPLRDIYDDPVDAPSLTAKPVPRCCEGFFRKVEYSYRMKPLANEDVDQARCATAYVND